VESQPGAGKLTEKRGQTVEPVFGRLKESGFEGFVACGLESCRAEWFLMTTADNFMKLARYAAVSGVD
jgi:hypothetical protein